MHFCLFLSLCRTASRPYRLSHVDALRINQSYISKNQSQKFSRKNIVNWRSPGNDFVQFLIFQFLVIRLFKKFCFCFFPMKNTKEVHMKQHLFFDYGWFLQNLEKGCIQTNMHTTVVIGLKYSFSILIFLPIHGKNDGHKDSQIHNVALAEIVLMDVYLY